MASGTAQKILEAAMDAFAESGFKATTTRDVAQRADVNLASVSYHWRSKEGLWEEVIRVQNDRMMDTARQAMCNEEDPAAAVDGFLRAVVRRTLEDPRPLRIMAWASMRPNDADYAYASNAYKPAVQLGAMWLKMQQAAGRIDPKLDVELALVTFYGLLAEPLLEPAVHRELFGVDHTDPAHAKRLEDHIVYSALRLLGLGG